MRSRFWAWYPPTEEEYQHLAREALVVPDTNILLAPYRLPSALGTTLLELLESLQERIWVPYQVAFEYQTHRLGVIAEQGALLSKLATALTHSRDAFEEEVGNLRQLISRHPTVSPDDINSWIKDTFDKLSSKIAEKRESIIGAGDAVAAKDFVHRRVSELLANRVGDPPNPDDLKAMFEEADDRFARKVPPGYLDAEKTEGSPYGDFLIWKAMIERARTEGKALVFVTEDQKADWWRVDGGMTAGPLPALREEFHKESGQIFWAYRLGQFMSLSEEFQVAAIDERVVEEVTDRIAHRSDLALEEAIEDEIAARESLIMALHRSVEAVSPAGSPAADQGSEAGRAVLRLRLDEELNALAKLKTRLAAIRAGGEANVVPSD